MNGQSSMHVVDLTMSDSPPPRAVGTVTPTPCFSSSTTTTTTSVAASSSSSSMEQQQQDSSKTSTPSSSSSSLSSSQPFSQPITAAVRTSAMKNPYKRKPFVGGAEQARKNAVKKSKGTRIMRPEERQQLDQVLPRRMQVFERFFAALLRSDPADFCASANNEQTSPQAQAQLWSTICQRVGLSMPTAAVRSSYERPDDHFGIRAALVLEEARNAIATPLASRYPLHASHSRSKPPAGQMILTIQLEEPGQAGSPHRRITFLKQAPFTKEELFHIRPGTILECRLREAPRFLANLSLAVVLSGSRDTIEKSHSFRVQFFRAPQQQNDRASSFSSDTAEWVVAPLASLISELRCFEAMVDDVQAHKVGFMHSLLGLKGATHTRFDNDDDECQIVEDPNDKHFAACHNNNNNIPPPQKEPASTKKALNMADFFAPKPPPPPMSAEELPFCLPQLNGTQQKAADAFLESKPHTITLVQGPPGTGKTTLLVSIICQYLLKHDETRRILVCAPTNKAISVLASRFVTAVKPHHHVNALLVGDADKLLTDERSNAGTGASAANESSPLRAIFVYSWLAVLTEDYRKLRNGFLPKARRTRTEQQTYELAARLERRLVQSLPHLDAELVALAGRITATLLDWQAGKGPAHDIVDLTESMLKALKKLNPDFVRTELINSAQVIFCTLVSAGGMILRGKLPVDDLIVDEAAASTEPELCIPFSLRPKRLLAVGDPLQLPATVLSKRAVALGLAKSLHERLMYECGHEHVMLDVQYRMHPSIASFASRTFYDSKIGNGPNVIPGGNPLYQPDQGDGTTSGARLLNKSPYLFLQVAGMEEHGAGGSYRNPVEARVIVDLVLECKARTMTIHGSSWSSADRIRIITFYQAQVGMLKNLLRAKGLEKVVVATVDSSQGCEADLVLVSFVRSRPHHDGKTLLTRAAAGFLTDNRRMNVALTRAKYQMICVGNAQAMACMTTAAPTLAALSEDATQRQILQTYPMMESKNGKRPFHNQPAAGNNNKGKRTGPPQKRFKLDYC